MRLVRPLEPTNFCPVYINHESSRKAFETPHDGRSDRNRKEEISITNLAERHLRLNFYLHLLSFLVVEISITNLAERHLRLPPTRAVPRTWALSDINHESSRKAFETASSSPRMHEGSSDINHESSRKAFETLPTGKRRCRSPRWISITNLAERHLRLDVCRVLEARTQPHINHESSRKAFETSRVTGASTVTSSRNINHESSRKAFETRHGCSTH